MISVKVNYAGVTAMARDLARSSAQPYDRVLRLETASIIKICALHAQIASLAEIKRDVAAKAAHNFVSPDESIVSTNVKQNVGRTWFVPGDKAGNSAAPLRAVRGQGPVQMGHARPIVGHGSFFMVFDTGGAKGWHLPDFYWQAYLLATNDRAGYIKARIAELARRRGLMRLSWLQVGDALGVPLSAVGPQGNLQEGIARAARAGSGRSYTNGSAAVSYGTTRLLITVRNASPLAIKNQGQGALDRAINQRVKGFEIAMQKGCLADLQLRARRWPGIFVTPGGAN